jgi:hypothetical protein
MKTAHRITRTGPARVRGEHLVAANQAKACRNCTGTCNEGKDCPGNAALTRATLVAFARAFGPHLLAILVALLMAAAPALLDGQGPQATQEISP